jgi:phenylalanyl-tRNA synthetase beta subunit
VLESANFDPILIRKTAEKYGIKTDASKRFENGISDELVADGINSTVNLILKEFPNAKIGAVTDIGNKNKFNYTIGVTLDEVNKTLGADISKEELESLFKILDFKFEIINLKKYIEEIYPKLIGAKYKNPASQRLDAPFAFSCSSLISYLYKGVWMPSLSIDKYVFSRRITKGELRFGDLIFSNTGEGMIRTQTLEFLRGTEVPDGVDHVAMYLGEGKVLHSTKVTGEVCVQEMSEYEKARKQIGFGRVIENIDIDIYVINVPEVRLDLRIKEDLIEEVGRVYGFEKLKVSLPKIQNKNKSFLNPKLSIKNEIRNILVSYGFSEVYNYSLSKEGEVELLKSASNKTKLRTNLSEGLIECYNRNIGNSALLELDLIKIFEIGNVFKSGKECTMLSICMDDGKKKSNFSESVDMLLSEIKRKLNVTKLEMKMTSVKPYIVEIDLDEFNKERGEVGEDLYLSEKYIHDDIKYKTYSLMPYIVRDVGFWINNENVNQEELVRLIKENAGSLCIKIVKFDEFKKEGRISLGYRLIYQSEERTLTDEEVNKESENVYKALKDKGYEIR